MRNMLDRVRERRMQTPVQPGEDPRTLNERIERDIVREDEQANIRQIADGRRNETTGY